MIQEKNGPFTYCLPDTFYSASDLPIEERIWRCIAFDSRAHVDGWVQALGPYIDSREVIQAKYYSFFRGNPSALIVYSTESEKEGLTKILDGIGVKKQRFWELQTQMHFLDRKLLTVARSIIGI